MSFYKKSGAANRKRQAVETENFQKMVASYPKIGKFFCQSSAVDLDASQLSSPQTVPTHSSKNQKLPEDKVTG